VITAEESETPLERFDIRFSPRIRWLLTIFGMGPSRTAVLVSQDSLRVKAGMFRVEIPRSRIAAVDEVRAPRWAMAGVHTNLRSRWIVNGAPGSLVRVRLSEPATASIAGLHVRLRSLDIGLTENARLMQILGAGGGG
jgi:hypothetical protein